MRIKSTRKELIGVQKSLEELSRDKSSFDKVYRDYNKFSAGNNFALMEKYCVSKSESKKLGIRIEEIKSKISEFKKNPLLLAMYDRVNECENNVSVIRSEITDCKAKIQNLESSVRDAKIVIDNLKANVDKMKEYYEDVLRDYPEYSSEVDKKYIEERKTKSAATIASNFTNQIAKDSIAFNNYLSQELIPTQQQYKATYTCDYPEGIEGANRYQQEYLLLKNIEIERHKEELSQAQVRCKDRFRKEVLFRMKDDILRARQQFRQINRVMENLEIPLRSGRPRRTHRLSPP